MMTYAFRDTHFARLHKSGCFWSADGEKWRGALQIYLRLPRPWIDHGPSDMLTRWRDSPNVSSREWTGRHREFCVRLEPGFLQIELRTPCNRNWSFKWGKL